MVERYEIKNGKKYHVVCICLKYDITPVFQYENNGYTIYKAYNNFVILYREV